MPQINQKVRSGNRAMVTFDGRNIGMIKSVRSNDDYSPEPASGIGDIHVQEYVPTMARHSLSVNGMVLRTGSLRQSGITAENGDAMLKGEVFDIEILSKDDNVLLRKYMGCSFASGDIEVQAHSILVNNATFNALDVSGTGI